MLALGTWAASLFLLLGVILFFIIAVINRQSNNLGINFNALSGFAGALLPYILIGVFWKVKYALIAGLILGIVGGFLGGQMLGGSDDG